MRIKKQGRNGITPVLATIILIAITLVVSVALAGIVFGLFGTLSNTAAFSVIITSANHMAASGVGTPTLSVTCGTTQPGSNVSYIELKNQGNGPGTVVAMSFIYNGVALAAETTGCSAGGGGIIYATLTFGGGITASNAGDAFSGSFTSANGAPVPFYGQFK